MVVLCIGANVIIVRRSVAPHINHKKRPRRRVCSWPFRFLRGAMGDRVYAEVLCRAEDAEVFEDLWVRRTGVLERTAGGSLVPGGRGSQLRPSLVSAGVGCERVRLHRSARCRRRLRRGQARERRDNQTSITTRAPAYCCRALRSPWLCDSWNRMPAVRSSVREDGRSCWLNRHALWQ
jgi:hypothetical protein